MLNMAGNVRGAMRPQGRSPPFLLIGLCVALCILGFNYWSLSYRNRELLIQMGDVQDQLRRSMSKRMTAERRGASVVDELKKCESSMDREKNEIARKESEVISLSEQLRNKVTENTECETKLKEIDELKTNLKTCEENNIGINQELQKKKEELKIALQQTPVHDAERCKLCKGQWDEEKKNFLNSIEKVLGPTALLQLRDAGVDIGHFAQEIGAQHKVKSELPNQQANGQAAIPPGQMSPSNFVNAPVNPNPAQGQAQPAQGQAQPAQGQMVVNMEKTAQDKNNNVLQGQPVQANPPETNVLNFNAKDAANGAQSQNAAANNLLPESQNQAANHPPPANPELQNPAANNPPLANPESQNQAANNPPPANPESQNPAANNPPPANPESQNQAANNPPPANPESQNQAANNPPPANPEPQNFAPMVNPVLGPVVNDAGGQQANQPPAEKAADLVHAGNQLAQPALPGEVPAPQNRVEEMPPSDSNKTTTGNSPLILNKSDTPLPKEAPTVPKMPLSSRTPTRSVQTDAQAALHASQANITAYNQTSDLKFGPGLSPANNVAEDNVQINYNQNAGFGAIDYKAGKPVNPDSSKILQGGVIPDEDGIDRLQHNMKIEDERIMNHVKSIR